MANTTRFAIAKPADADLVTNGAGAMRTIADGFDAITLGWSSDVIARRPTAGTAGRVFLARDDTTSGPNGTLYFDNGTAWVIVPSNNYGSGLLASRPRTTIRGQYYYATDDTTASANGTLYINDGTGWVQITGLAAAFTSYKDLPFERTALFTDGNVSPSNVYILGPGAPSSSPNQVFIALNCPPHGYQFYFDPADWAAGSRTVQLRLNTWIITNAQAPSTTFQFGLYPVTAWSGARAAAPAISTLGAAVSGSTISYATPSASAHLQGVTAAFTAPAAGFYVLGFSDTGTVMATGAQLSAYARLQLRQT